jgi:hypothetical protein
LRGVRKIHGYVHDTLVEEPCQDAGRAKVGHEL